jgi:uncharacterized protein
MRDESGTSKTAPTTFRSPDGLLLSGSFDSPEASPTSSIVLVHGGGATREEGGFFTRLAASLASRGVASLRFDLRGHGKSAGQQEDLTLSGVLNDIRAAVGEARRLAGDVPVNILGASFGGGICAYFAAHYPDDVTRLVLINPLINYKKRFVDDKPYWSHDQIDEAAGRELSQQGFLAHSPTFKLGRPYSTRFSTSAQTRRSGGSLHRRWWCTAPVTRSFQCRALGNTSRRSPPSAA